MKESFIGRSSIGVSIADEPDKKEGACQGEPYLMCLRRWLKIQNDFKSKKKENKFDISKISEICDNSKFDNLHCPQLLSEDRLELMDLSQLMCRAIVPFEYGLTTEEKIDVGIKIIHPLLNKIHDDLLWWTKTGG